MAAADVPCRRRRQAPRHWIGAWCVCWMHTTNMGDTHDKNPSARALARWETEGGALRNGRNPRRPLDPNQDAKLIIDMAMGEALRGTNLESGKNPAALALGRLGVKVADNAPPRPLPASMVSAHPCASSTAP